MTHHLFELFRRTHADWYTAGPLASLDEAHLARLAVDTGMTLDQLRKHLQRPHVEMTCPLCGQASTHLVLCKGCGGDAWGWEFEMAHGEMAVDELRKVLRETLIGAEFDAEAVGHAVRHAYSMGGCMICPTCWHHTLPHDACYTCPLVLFSERTLEGEGYVPTAYLLALIQGQCRETWAKAVRARWCEHWNTVEAGQEAVARWRGTILEEALADDRMTR